MSRPTVMTEATVKKLLYAFSNSFSDEEACCYAWISKQTLYNYWRDNPEFLDRKKILKHKPSVKAKLNLVEAIEAWNIQISKFWLEKKSHREFWNMTPTSQFYEPERYEMTPEEKEKIDTVLRRTLDKLKE